MPRPGYDVHAVHVWSDEADLVGNRDVQTFFFVALVDDEGGEVEQVHCSTDGDDAWDAGCALADEWMTECVEIDEHGTALRRYRAEGAE